MLQPHQQAEFRGLTKVSHPLRSVSFMATLTFGGPVEFDLDLVRTHVNAACNHLANVRADQPVLDALGDIRRHVTALEAETLAAMKRAGGSDRKNESAVRSTGVTKTEAKRAASRANAVNTNPALATQLAQGELNEPELDAIAHANDETNGKAANSAELTKRVRAAGPDRAKAVAKEWVDEQRTQNDTDTRYAEQRRRRTVSRFTTRRRTAAILFEGDDETIDQVWDAISADANALYRADGGRDVPTHKHPRTRDQRRFDAFANRVLRSAGPDSVSETGSSAGSASPKATVHIITHLADWTPDGPLEGFDLSGRRLPRAVLDRMLCDADVVGTVFDTTGEILFHGRTKRFATPAQIRALIARDRGCVLCSAHPNRCEAHHLTPWESPARGETNVDELALVCADCHHHLHDNNLTLEWATGPPTSRGHPTRTWRTRPALPHEIALHRTAA